MGCPPVRGDNPLALTSGLSYVQVGKHGITILSHLHQLVDLAHHEIFWAKDGKIGIIYMIMCRYRFEAGITHDEPFLCFEAEGFRDNQVIRFPKYK